MKIFPVIEIDKENALGLKTLHLEKINSKSILELLISNLKETQLFYKIVVSIHKDYKHLLPSSHDESIEIFIHDYPDISNRKYLRKCRLWSPNSWRGGLDNSFYCCSFGNPYALRDIIKKFELNGVILFDFASPFVIDEFIKHQLDIFKEVYEDIGFCISNAPVGLNYIFLNEKALSSMIKQDGTLQNTLKYDPKEPKVDPTYFPYFYNVPAPISGTKYCFAAYTKRDLIFISNVYKSLSPPETHDWRKLLEKAKIYESVLYNKPWLVEIEINSQAPEDKLRITPVNTGRDYSLTLEDYYILLEHLNPTEMLLIIGGYSDPLYHSQVSEFLKISKKRFLSVAMYTYLDRKKEEISRVMEASPDVLIVRLDAFYPETFQKVRKDNFKKILDNIEYLLSVRRDSMFPVIMVEFVKSIFNYSEMDIFFDFWYNKGVGVILKGFNNMAGEVENFNPLPLFPSRRPCQRILREIFVFSNGKVPVCAQDFKGTHIIGDLLKESIEKIWSHPFRLEIIKNHFSNNYNVYKCKDCRDWIY